MWDREIQQGNERDIDDARIAFPLTSRVFCAFSAFLGGEVLFF
jgi:hypothetical protein